MIIDSLANAAKYEGLHPLFAQAFNHIRHTPLATSDPGKSDIAEGLKAILSQAPGKTEEASLAKFECHNQHIDIQYCVNGKERIGWRPRASCVQPKGEYDAEKDVLFFADKPDTFFELQDGQFAIFFPEDVHAPMIGEGEIRKLVIKVKI